jgi:hypothetical protein
MSLPKKKISKKFLEGDIVRVLPSHEVTCKEREWTRFIASGQLPKSGDLFIVKSELPNFLLDEQECRICYLKNVNDAWHSFFVLEDDVELIAPRKFIVLHSKHPSLPTVGEVFNLFLTDFPDKSFQYNGESFFYTSEHLTNSSISFTLDAIQKLIRDNFIKIL